MNGGEHDTAVDVTYYLLYPHHKITLSNDDHIRVACFQGRALSYFHLWIIVGKWTLAATDCAKNFRGHGQGALCDGSCNGTSPVGDCSNKSSPGESSSPLFRSTGCFLGGKGGGGGHKPARSRRAMGGPIGRGGWNKQTIGVIKLG